MTIKVRYVHPQHAFRIIPDASVPDSSNEDSVLEAIEAAVHGHGANLVQLYFRIIHPAFPILHKEVFLEKYSRSFREFSPPLLAAVYLLALGYWSYSDALSMKRKPPTQPLKKLAMDSLYVAMERAKLSTIQACLLISQEQTNELNLISGETQLNITAQLVQLAHRLGLHLDAEGWLIPAWETSLRRRLSWAVFIQDKWLALVHGRPSLISSTTWDVDCLSEDDFPETNEDDTAGSSEVEKGRLVFMHMADLAGILSDVLDNLFSPRAQRSSRVGDYGLIGFLELIKPLQIRLKDWFSALPERLKHDTVASMKLSSVGYLRLAYLAIEASIHRHITTTLQASHLASFWYLTSPECAALIYHLGSLLEATTGDADEKADLGQMLKACRWTLKVNGEAGANFMRHALSLVDASEQVTVLASNDLRATVTPSSAGGDMLYGLSGSVLDDFNVAQQAREVQLPSNEMASDDIFAFVQDFE
ncbi:hypothetical protein E4T51_07743 [Aureobasidium sp. EXF-12344]|nr:hypothetical protein E4T51_07743 [Aureobasidium sp. EXF-12344]